MASAHLLAANKVRCYNCLHLNICPWNFLMGSTPWARCKVHVNHLLPGDPIPEVQALHYHQVTDIQLTIDIDIAMSGFTLFLGSR